MRSIIFLGILSLALARKTFFGDQVLTVHPKNEAQVQAIKNLESRVDFWSPDSSAGVAVGSSADIRIPSEILPAVKVMLRRQKIEFEVMIEDVESLVGEQLKSARERGILDGASGYNYNVYHTYGEINDWTHSIAAENPTKVKRTVIGTSYEGREIPMLTLSSQSASNPEILVDCGIHAREWISPAFCQWFVRQLLDETNGRISEATYYIIPSINVDGYAYTWTDDRMWRKTRSPQGVCVGVDPNRNWDAGFGGEGSSSTACSQTYHGPAPESEPEVKAVADFMRQHRDTVKLYVTYHSYGQMILYPYSYTYALAPNTEELDFYAVQGKNAIRSVHNKRFTYGPGAATIYPAAGGSDDFAYDTGIKLSYTVELRDTGAYGFTLPESQIQAACEETDAFMKVMHEAVVNPSYV